jgi:hypothetical protein
MSQTAVHLVGDSNVIRYLPLVKSVKDDPFVQDATMSRAVNVIQLQDALSSPQKGHPVVIIAALTNPVISYPFEDYSGMKRHCDQFFSQVKAWIAAGRAAIPGAFAKVGFAYIHDCRNIVHLFLYLELIYIIFLGLRNATYGEEHTLLV